MLVLNLLPNIFNLLVRLNVGCSFVNRILCYVLSNMFGLALVFLLFSFFSVIIFCFHSPPSSVGLLELSFAPSFLPSRPPGLPPPLFPLTVSAAATSSPLKFPEWVTILCIRRPPACVGWSSCTCADRQPRLSP